MNKYINMAAGAALAMLTAMPSTWAAEKWSYYAIHPVGGWPGNRIAEAFERIKERTGGELEIQYVNFSETPYKATEGLQLLKSNLVEMVELTNVYITNTHPIFAIGSLPFLSKNHLDVQGYTAFSNELWSIDKVASQVSDVFKNNNALELGTHYATPGSIFFSGEMKSLDDIAGLRMRVIDPEGAALMVELGATPVSLTAGDVYSALQRGGLDGYIAGPSGVIPFHWDELTKTAYIANLNQSKNSLLVNKSKFDSLDPDLQKVLEEEMAKAGQQLRDEIVENQNQVLGAFTARGITVKQPSEEEYQKLREIAKNKVWPAWVAQRSEQEKQAFDAVMDFVE